eukprot:TRINITY_DN13678_c0_g1_i1.p1 TRINITY_DN13678_c0_g1~~TRINITY_DN13678_c0_g1_i1.p1  ORF type:complete len:435 (+),score=95.10 TRINITY_DN13678_c0_g1_i1:23-1306(+)
MDEEVLIRHLHKNKVMPDDLFKNHIRLLDSQIARSKALRARLGNSQPASPVKYIARKRAATLRKRDRYGFVVDGEEKNGRTHRSKEMEEFLKIHKRDELTADNKPFLDLLMKHGLPDPERENLWKRFTEHNTITHQITPYKIASEMKTPNPSIIAIEKDMDRTFPDCNHFDAGQSTREELQTVLLRYSAVNSDGYCQGMNFITGILLLFVSEESAYEILTRLTTSPEYNGGYYGLGMESCNADQRVLENLVKESLPGVVEKLEEFNICLTNLVVRWFLTVFVDSFPVATVLKLWDFYLLYGIRFTFAFSLAFLSIYSEKILESEDLASVVTLVQDTASSLTDPAPIISLGLSSFLLTQTQLDEMRSEAKASLQELKEQRDRDREQLRRKREQQQKQPTGKEPGSPSSPGKSLLKGFMNLRGKKNKEG